MSDIKEKLQAWLARQSPERETLAISEFSTPQTGASNETLLFDISWQEQGESFSLPLVARLEPASKGLFPDYNLALQHRTMQRLQDTDVKVPRVGAIEMDPSVIGQRFYIMQRLDGRYLADNPPYQMEGWFTRQSPEICGAIWENALQQMAAVNRVDWKSLGFADLWDHNQYDTPLKQLLDYYEGFLNWAETIGRPFKKLHPVLQYLKQHQPENEPVALCWGDAKPANLMIAHDSAEIIGLLDWEMVHLGNPVHDLAWWFVLDDSLTRGLGLSKVKGLPDRARMVELWQQASGYSGAQLDYYELLSNFQFAIIMHRVGTMLTTQGMFKPEDEFDINNNSSLLMDEQISKFGI